MRHRSLQAENIRVHVEERSLAHIVKFAMASYFRPDEPVVIGLQATEEDDMLLRGHVPQPEDWLRAWRITQDPRSWNAAEHLSVPRRCSEGPGDRFPRAFRPLAPRHDGHCQELRPRVDRSRRASTPLRCASAPTRPWGGREWTRPWGGRPPIRAPTHEPVSPTGILTTSRVSMSLTCWRAAPWSGAST